jgi:hypothetical protein
MQDWEKGCRHAIPPCEKDFLRFIAAASLPLAQAVH